MARIKFPRFVDLWSDGGKKKRDWSGCSIRVIFSSSLSVLAWLRMAAVSSRRAIRLAPAAFFGFGHPTHQVLHCLLAG